MHIGHGIQWFWYILGAVLCLVWKWQKYCYEHVGLGMPPRRFWDSSREWFEIETFGSKVSWTTTVTLVWVVGTVYIERVGIDWLFSGFFMGVPTAPAFACLFGGIAELVAPAAVKFIVRLMPFGKDTDL